MAALGTSLTWLELMKLFQDGLYDIIQTRGKKKGSPGEVFLRQLLPDNVTESVIEQVNTLLAKMSKNGGSKWKDALDSAHITIVRGNSTYKRKLSFKYWNIPTTQLVDCIPDKKKNLPIVDPPSIEDTINSTTVLIETAENNVVNNGVMKVDNSNNATMEEEEEEKVRRRTCICISKRKEYFQNIDLDGLTQGIKSYWSKSMGCWRSYECCIGKLEKATLSVEARCRECKNVLKNWKRMLQNYQKKSTIASIQPQNAKQVSVNSMMQQICTLLEDDSISETDKITIAKQLVQDTPFPSMTKKIWLKICSTQN